jgi:hypothetical protein
VLVNVAERHVVERRRAEVAGGKLGLVRDEAGALRAGHLGALHAEVARQHRRQRRVHLGGLLLDEVGVAVLDERAQRLRRFALVLGLRENLRANRPRHGQKLERPGGGLDHGALGLVEDVHVAVEVAEDIQRRGLAERHGVIVVADDHDDGQPRFGDGAQALGEDLLLRGRGIGRAVGVAGEEKAVDALFQPALHQKLEGALEVEHARVQPRLRVHTPEGGNAEVDVGGV